MENILDIQPEKQAEEYTDASGTQRFGNYIVDFIFTVIALLILGAILGGFFSDGLLGDDSDIGVNLFFYFSYVFIMFLFENFTGKTPGKYLTRTHVITTDGGKPTTAQYFGRNLARLIPFDPFSFLFGRGWHDSVSKTRVVLD